MTVTGAELMGSGFDIVHVHAPIAGFLVRAASRRIPLSTRPAVVYTEHGFHFHRDGVAWTNAFYLTAERVVGRWTDALIVTDHEDQEAASRHHIVPRRRLVHMLGVGVDTGHSSCEAVPAARLVEARREVGLGDATPLIVMVREQNRNKRPRDVLKALSHMRHAKAHRAFPGDCPERPTLKSWLRSSAYLGASPSRDLSHGRPFRRDLVRWGWPASAKACPGPSSKRWRSRCQSWPRPRVAART